MQRELPRASLISAAADFPSPEEGRMWTRKPRSPRGLSEGLPEPRCWLGATWLSLLDKQFLFLARL